MTVRLLLVLSVVVVTVSTAGLLETLLSWELPATDGEARSTASPSKCLCQTMSCLCCVDFNLTSTIDLGGPACLNIGQKEQNVTLNMSYGDNDVHNATIKLVDAVNKPICMNLLADLAQICARFTTVKQADTGHDACVVMEPALLGTPQASYHIGCFNFNEGIRQTEVSIIKETTEVPEVTETTTEDEDNVINTEELIAAVSASAEQGIALFSQWLGLNLNPKLNLTSSDVGETAEENSAPEETSRTSKKMTTFQLEKNDERFKQLLSAQDNIQKESARIGHADSLETTFVYSKPMIHYTSENIESQKVDKIDPVQLSVIPKESRRGGRAYNIHQHVNEV